MNCLLDTHIFIWLTLNPAKLPPTVLTTLESSDTELFLSVVSVWEMQIKAMIGKLDLPTSVEDFVLTQRRFAGIQSTSIIEPHIWTLAELPQHHRDPFDQLLIAQALHMDFTLVTIDTSFSQYDVKLLP